MLSALTQDKFLYFFFHVVPALMLSDFFKLADSFFNFLPGTDGFPRDHQIHHRLS